MTISQNRAPGVISENEKTSTEIRKHSAGGFNLVLTVTIPQNRAPMVSLMKTKKTPLGIQKHSAGSYFKTKMENKKEKYHYLLLKAEGGKPIMGKFKTKDHTVEMRKLTDCEYLTPIATKGDWFVLVDEEGAVNHNSSRPNIYFTQCDTEVFGDVLIVQDSEKGIIPFTEEELEAARPTIIGELS